MDKGKGVTNEWTSSNSDHSDSDSNIGPLKKHKVDYEAIIEELCRERDYWKNAYLKEHRLYQVYSRWAKDEMERLASRHRSQHYTIKNMAAQNRSYFNHIRGDLMMKVDEALRQAMDSMGAMEWLA